MDTGRPKKQTQASDLKILNISSYFLQEIHFQLITYEFIKVTHHHTIYTILWNPVDEKFLDNFEFYGYYRYSETCCHFNVLCCL